MSNFYFTGVAAADLQTQYRRLAQRMHPDKGGDTKAFQEMKREYELRASGLWKGDQENARQQAEAREAKQRQQSRDDYYYDRYRDMYKRKILEKTMVVSMDKYLDGLIREVSWKGSDGSWDIKLRQQYNDVRKLGDNGVHVANLRIRYVEELLTVKFKEHGLSRIFEKITGEIYTVGGRRVGYLTLPSKDVFSDRVKTVTFDKVDDIHSASSIQFKYWDIKKWSMDIEKFKPPTSWYGKLTLWISRKIAKWNN